MLQGDEGELQFYFTFF